MKLLYRNVYRNVPGKPRGLWRGNMEFYLERLQAVLCTRWDFIGVETVAYTAGHCVIVFFDPAKP